MRKYIIIAFVPVYILTGCDLWESSESNKITRELVDKSIANMIPVPGGEFIMGDFGPLIGEKLPFSMNRDDKILHKVIISDFSISKYKVTNSDYAQYLKSNNKKPLPVNLFAKRHPSLREGEYSVCVTWQQAKDYCLWLGQMSGKNIDLPTEAQWEYAARSGGQFLPFATNNGQFEQGKNLPDYNDLVNYTDGVGLPIYPVGKYPPNPLGLYDMGLSGAEWTNDWYSNNYYASSPLKDPKGPVAGKMKVLRGYIGGDKQYALTMFRQSANLIPEEDYNKYGVSQVYVFRCAINN